MVANDSAYMCKDGNSCGLTGAAAFFAGIPGTAIVLNSSLWCYFSARGYVEKQCPSAGIRFFSSQRSKDAVPHGTEEYLLHILLSIKEASCPSVVLLANSCTDSTGRDNLLDIAKRAKMNCPIVCLDSHALAGGFWAGYQAASQAYFQMMFLQPRSKVKPKAVNLLGCSAGYYNSVHDLQELRRMLNLAGYEVLACPGAGSTIQEISAMTQAQFNVVIHDELGRDLARILEEQYNMPYLSLLPPYGLKGSLSWVKAIDDYLPGEGSGFKALQQESDVLEQELNKIGKEQQKSWGEMRFDNILIAAPSSVAVSISQAVSSEWINTKKITMVLHNGVPFDWSYSAYMGTVLDAYKDGQQIEQHLAGLAGGLLLASSREKAIVHQKAVENVAYQSISLPVYDEIPAWRPLMGLEGNRHMVEKLWGQYIRGQKYLNMGQQVMEK